MWTALLLARFQFLYFLLILAFEYLELSVHFLLTQVLNISHNYINEESFKADIFADMRTLDTVDLQRNRSVKSAVTVFMVEDDDDDGLHTM